MTNKNYKINIPKRVKYIIDTLNEFEYESFIVGGCVRDSLLNRIPKDFDITTNAKPKEVMEIFQSLGFKVIPTGIKHGTVTVMIDNIGYEITTYRIDGEYLNNRHPDKVEFTSNLKDDLSRRDFTINAMAYNDKTGLIDYFNGLEDIKNKIIRCVGNPIDRFNEDALRMLRCVRFSSQLNFEMEDNTLSAIIELNNNILNISQERIRDELCKILVSDKPENGLIHLARTDLLKNIIPELIPTIKFQQYNKHHDKYVFHHILSVLTNTSNKLELRLSALLHDIGKPKCFTIDEDGQGHFYQHNKISADMSREILTRLKFDNKTIDKVCVLVYEHMSRYDKLRTTSTKKFINRVGISNLDDLFELQIADIKGASVDYQDFSSVLKLKEECIRILNEKQPLSVKDLNINGKDLMNIGVKQGKEIGLILNDILNQVLENPELNTKEMLLKLANNLFKGE